MRAQRYADGELTGVEHEMYEAHLPACGECGEFLREIQALKSVFGRKSPEAPARDIEKAVLSRVAVWEIAREKERFGEALGAMSKRFLPAAAVLCAMMVLLLYSSMRAVNRSESVSPESYYSDSFSEQHEQALLAANDDNARDSLYAVMTEKEIHKTSE
jgi:hypothetical protein